MLTFLISLVTLMVVMLVGGRMNKIKAARITWEAIDSVRDELAQAAREGDEIKAQEILTRLSNLYASIDAKGFVKTLREMEQANNVICVDFRKRETIKKAVGHDLGPTAEISEIIYPSETCTD